MKILRAALYIVIVAVLLFVGFKIEFKLNEYRTAYDIHTERTMTLRRGRDVSFAKLKRQCDDIKGWIWLPDTNIDYPIVQGEDNDYYLHRDIDGSYLFDGSIFIDASVNEPFSKDENTVIYGHRMSSGAMFHDLRKYGDDADYIKEHNIIYIETEDRSYDLHVIAFCSELADSPIYVTEFLDESDLFADEFGLYESDDLGDMDDEQDVMSKAEFIEFVRDHAKYLSGQDFGPDDTYVTLSTCAYSSGDKRNQVVGILKEAPMEEKTVEVKTKKPLVNRWLVLQIVVGAVMVLAVVLPLVPRRRG